MKIRTIRGEESQDAGLGPSSMDRCQASSSAYLTSAAHGGSRWQVPARRLQLRHGTTPREQPWLDPSIS